MTLPELAGIFGIIIGAVLTALNIRNAWREQRKAKHQDDMASAMIDENRLTIVANSAQVATGFLQEVLKRADKEIEDRDRRIAMLEDEVRDLRAEVAELRRRLGV